MQLAFHIGANCTDCDRLLKSVLKNADALLKEGTVVPGPGRYRALIRETIQSLDGAKPAPDTRDVLLDAIVENDNAERLVLSNDNFICIPNRIFDHGLLYSQAAAKTKGLSRLFPDDDVSLFLTIRNPVTFLQETFQRANANTVEAFLGIMQPQEIRWDDVVRRIKSAVPHIPLTVWCHEDSPLLWEQLIRAFSGATFDEPVAGGFDLLASIISPNGMAKLQELHQNPEIKSAPQKHELIAEIWEDEALSSEIEDEVTLDELDPALIAQMTKAYDEDVEKIGHMEGVNLLLPFE